MRPRNAPSAVDGHLRCGFWARWLVLWLGVGVLAMTGSVAALEPVGPAAGQSSVPLAGTAEVYLDVGGTLDLAAIGAGRVPFGPQRGASFGTLLTRGTLWIRALIKPWPDGGSTYLLLNNGSLESVTLYAPVRGQDGAALRILRGGWQYATTGAQERFVSPVFRLPADYDDARPLLIAVTSPYLLQFRVTLLTEAAWQRTGMELLLFLGLGLGSLVAILLYNLLLYAAIGDRHYLYYLLYAVTLVLYLGVDPYVGLARFVAPGTAGALMPYFPVFPLLMLAAMINFSRAFLASRQTAPRHDRLLRALLVAPLSVILMVVMGYPWEAARVTYVLLHILILLQVTVGFVVLRSGFRPARCFLLAVSAPVMGVLTFSAQVNGLLPHNALTVRALFIGFILEALLLSFALGNRTWLLRQEREASERLLLEHSKFLSVGQMLSGVLHQLKRPVIHAGNRLMILEALLERPAAEREAALPGAVAELRRTVGFMARTLEDVYRFYGQDQDRVSYRPAEQIELAVTLLTPMAVGSALRIERALLPDLVLHGYPHAFAHVLLIVIENAAVVLRERAVTDPLIRIEMAVAGDELWTTVADNAGGIRVQPIARIFDLITRPDRGSGIGIGLGLARRLVETKLDGRISARNRDRGAEFTIRLPLGAAGDLGADQRDIQVRQPGRGPASPPDSRRSAATDSASRPVAAAIAKSSRPVRRSRLSAVWRWVSVRPSSRIASRSA